MPYDSNVGKPHFKYEKILITNTVTNEQYKYDDKEEAKLKYTELSTGKNKITCEKIYPDYKQSVVIREQFNF